MSLIEKQYFVLSPLVAWHCVCHWSSVSSLNLLALVECFEWLEQPWLLVCCVITSYFRQHLREEKKKQWVTVSAVFAFLQRLHSKLSSPHALIANQSLCRRAKCLLLLDFASTTYYIKHPNLQILQACSKYDGNKWHYIFFCNRLSHTACLRVVQWLF